MRQVEHRHQHLLAVYLGSFQPDDVVGQGRHLLGGQAHAHRQVELLLALDGVVHQVAVQLLVGVLAVDEALAGTGYHRLLNQLLLIEAVAQALGALVGVVAEVGQQVVRAHELLEVGERRVGFDQVLVRVAAHAAVGQALHAFDAERGRGRAVHSGSLADAVGDLRAAWQCRAAASAGQRGVDRAGVTGDVHRSAVGGAQGGAAGGRLGGVGQVDVA
ncbi:hypothetical protein D3C77_138920 [compost metagenome]